MQETKTYNLHVQIFHSNCFICTFSASWYYTLLAYFVPSAANKIQETKNYDLHIQSLHNVYFYFFSIYL